MDKYKLQWSILQRKWILKFRYSKKQSEWLTLVCGWEEPSASTPGTIPLAPAAAASVVAGVSSLASSASPSASVCSAFTSSVFAGSSGVSPPSTRLEPPPGVWCTLTEVVAGFSSINLNVIR